MENTLNDRKNQEILIAVNNIKWTFGKGSKVRVWDVSPDHWQSLCQILEISSRQCDDFFQVRSVVIESGVIKVLLDCLSIYTHLYPVQPCTSNTLKRKADPESDEPKESATQVQDQAATISINGIGFGFGDVGSAWKLEETLKKQLGEEKHITAMLQILASYMNPQDEIPSDAIPLPFLFVNLLEQSCLVPVIRSYMRNDSMLDMTKHIPLYRSITLLIRAISTCSELVHLLMMKQDEMDEPIADLLTKIRKMTETYKSRVR
jgi:baculoviral IAP repeat-containing protein 6 (apollon)